MIKRRQWVLRGRWPWACRLPYPWDPHPPVREWLARFPVPFRGNPYARWVLGCGSRGLLGRESSYPCRWSWWLPVPDSCPGYLFLQVTVLILPG
ncbi:hypothetical protein YIM73052_19740 [Thermus antranikianii]